MLEVQCRSPANLTASEWEQWERVLDGDEGVNSPFCAGQLVRLVGEIRGGVEVGVLRDDGRSVGFFPFQRCGRTAAEPVLGGLSEIHGVVVPAGVRWSVHELLQGCGLATWRFHHLATSQMPTQPFHWGRVKSPAIDLSGGFESYRQDRRRSGSRLLDQILRKSRKLAREQGPLRFEYHDLTEAPLAALLEWKTAQHRKTGMLPVLEIPWVRQLVGRLQQTQSEVFSGVFSTLYAGDSLAAVHLGLRRRNRLHVWFPAYDARLSSYSPGLILLVEIARAANAAGLERIELGKGSEPYKTSLGNQTRWVAEGVASTSRVSNLVGRRWYGAKARIRSSSLLGRPYEAVASATRRLRQQRDFD